ncbi:MAG: sigma-70 family RNA polymerase sigma factor [Planctomycetota bacterium]|nr:MAG: sigma-70 family RNA polymerase sigma factor [Planctomycetota bacterium]
MGRTLLSSPEPSELRDLDDGELVARCLRAGEHYDAAFEQLYARHASRVFGFLLKLTGNRSAAEDALQETFLRVYKSLERFDARRSLSAWLLQIARYVAIDAYRVEKKVRRLEERRAAENPEGTRGEVEGEAERNERERVVGEVLAELSIEDRSLLLLRHFEGMTFREIGEAIDCSARTAQNRVEAAARRFQRALKGRRIVGRGDL